MTAADSDPDSRDGVVGAGAGPSRLQLQSCMPRRAPTVSTARHLVDTALALVGVAEDCRADIALALTEACANAVRHAQGDEYQIIVRTDGDQCVVEVIDDGAGPDRHRIDRIDGQHPAEHGRGLALIRACTDAFEFRRLHPHGSTIRMSKELTWATTAAY
jgi:serine/threonine-protein kinase RsbW